MRYLDLEKVKPVQRDAIHSFMSKFLIPPATRRWFTSFVPGPISVRWPERLRSCLGALLGIAFTGGSMHLLLGPPANILLLVAPMGASAVLLFGVPASPLAQPWSIIGGNLVSATVGVACARWISNPVDAAALAIALAICVMFALRCVHPPSGAVALTAVLGGPTVHAMGFSFVLEPIAIQSAALLCTALIYHAATGHRYPHAGRVSTADNSEKSSEIPNLGFTRVDLETVLSRRTELLDIGPDDLESLLRETQLQAYARTFSELTCANIMSKTVVSISASTRANDVWKLLDSHSVKALPVVDTAQHVIGIVTRADLIDKPIFERIAAWQWMSRHWFKRQTLAAPMVGNLMHHDVCTIAATTPIVELVPIFSQSGHHHIPVVDAGKRLVGMITQADLITGLYQQTYAQQQHTA